MKNPYAKETHFSKRKFRKFLQLFCKDFTATQIADFMNVNRKTANLWINKIRMRILLIVEQEKLCNAVCVQMDETYFTKTKEYFPKYKLPHEEIAVFGIIDSAGRVYAKIVEKVDIIHVFPVIFEVCAKDATIYTDSAVLYKGLSKLGYKHHAVNHRNMEFSRYENGACITTNMIEGYWGWLKVRLGKFRGVKWDNLDLHIAESVWRYNHRQDDIYKLLLKEFRVDKL
ncbi:MAG: IS1595 family transposase [Proteobacteria bacterium]|nr:IS1595 family transposase [Pseudomonadota bacterium]